jgi:glycine oxidase
MHRSRDIVVIGAGIVGGAIAYELARRGAAVEIVDDRSAAMGATQASAGILAPFIEARAGSPLMELSERSLDLFDEFVARVGSDAGVQVPYRRSGTLDVAADGVRMAELEGTAASLAARDITAAVLDASAVRSEEPHLADHVVGGLLIPSHGFVSAAELTRALCAAARRHGAQLVEGCRVKRIVPGNGELVVDTERGPLTADSIVIAAGSWSGAIEVDGVTIRVPVRPVRGQLLHLGWSGPPLRRVTWSSRCYLVPWEDGTLLVGATVEEAGFDERATVAGVRDLLDAAVETVPHARSAAFLGARVGLRPAAPDDLPIIGRSQAVPAVVYATAHYRNGVLLAPITASLVADLMLDNRDDPALARFAPRRFGLL